MIRVLKMYPGGPCWPPGMPVVKGDPYQPIEEELMPAAARNQPLAYPGAPVLLMCVSRKDETGDVRVQQYDDSNFRVATFLPGIVVALPGDSVKVEPEISQWVKSLAEARPVFDRYVAQAIGAGWSRVDMSPD